MRFVPTPGLLLRYLPGGRYLLKFMALGYYRVSKWFKTNDKKTTEKYGIVFICSPNDKGWILGTIAQNIANCWPGTSTFFYGDTDLPDGEVYLFTHFSLLRRYFVKYPALFYKTTLVHYTHPRDIGQSEKEVSFWLNQASLIICMNSHAVNLLKKQGVKQVVYNVGAADPNIFKYHSRGNGKVGFCSAYYERKNPDYIFAIIKAIPEYEFILLGKNWEEYSKFQELQALKNFTYVDTEYMKYPEYYATMDVFVSVSLVEGGPIPLLEAMMSNVVPVVSSTGFATDIIRHGENGFIYNMDQGPEVVCDLIRRAKAFDKDIRDSVTMYNWENYSNNIYRLSMEYKNRSNA